MYVQVDVERQHLAIGGNIVADDEVISALISTHHNVSMVDASMGVAQFIGMYFCLLTSLVVHPFVGA